ncbi:DUF4062 domain-containing protein [Arthrobacter sp. R4]|uniref:DUF4062 domain-containing protein n=1 Tax=Arthrobacter sp. R4 TaxID=644417 RepID=UPI003ED972CE
MDRRYQVFISSTFTDLIEERKEVIQALLELDCLPAGMEMFPAADDDQWTLIKKVIDQSDFYVVVVGGRYGSMSAAGISYTEMEYDYAVTQGKTILGFAHANPGSIPADKTEMDTAARTKLDEFRAKVQTRHVKYYNNSEDLGGKVSRALSLAMRGTTAHGWVRGEFAMTAEKQAEFSELRAKVSELTLALESVATAQGTIPEDLASGDDTFAMESIIDYYSVVGLHAQENLFEPAEVEQDTTTVPVTWNEIMAELAPRLVDEASEDELATALNGYAQRLLLGDRKDLLPSSLGQVIDVQLSRKAFDDILWQLFSLNITAHGSKTRSTADKGKYWRLTDLGRDTLMKLRAIKKPLAVEASQ